MLVKKVYIFYQEELSERWDAISGELSALLQDLEEINEDVTPFDATSDIAIDEQRCVLPHIIISLLSQTRLSHHTLPYPPLLLLLSRVFSLLVLRLDCVRRIYEHLHEYQLAAAVALLRAAREVWPDNEEFGAVDISPEDEFMVRLL